MEPCFDGGQREAKDRDPCMFNVIVNSAERVMEIFIGAKRQDSNGVKNER